MEDLLQASAISSESLNVQLLTPLLMHGWQKTIIDRNGKPQNRAAWAETRALSFKGVLRYWWRAAQCTTDSLLTREIALFGGVKSGSESGRRSPVILRFDYQQDNSLFAMLPHRKESFKAVGLKPGQRLKLTVAVQKKDKHQLGFYISTVKLALALGGFGQRARRGHGSFQLLGKPWEDIAQFKQDVVSLIQQLGQGILLHRTSAESEKCVLRLGHGETPHPTIRHVWIGRGSSDPENVLRIISNAGHVVMSKLGSGGRDQYLLGMARSGRQASPLHGTVRQIGRQFYPVVTEVITQPDELLSRQYKEQRDAFLQAMGVRPDE